MERIYKITPMGAPRMTRADAWRKRGVVLRYHAFRDECRSHRVNIPLAGAHITFVMPMPRSWSKRRRIEMKGTPHQQKPDLDNALKALLDAVMDEDKTVYDCRVSKVWGDVGLIIVRQPKSAAQ